jgi:hypothetical protein
MGRIMEEKGRGVLGMVPRHQHLVDPRIPYTSHNSSASLVVESERESEMIDFCSDFLYAESAKGSDAGLCVAKESAVNADIIRWGTRAKAELLYYDDALATAAGAGIFLEGLIGEKIGAIGALAAVGLRKGGNDGRVLWMKNLRETNGVYSPDQVCSLLAIHRVLNTNFEDIPAQSIVSLGDWTRPVLRNGEVVLFVEKTVTRLMEYYETAREFTKKISD